MKATQIRKREPFSTDSEDRFGGSPEPENQANGQAMSKNPIEVIDGADRELSSPPLHIQTGTSSRPKPRALKDPL